MRAIVLKNHYEPTASLAYIVRKEVPGIEVFGGISLDLTVPFLSVTFEKPLPKLRELLGRKLLDLFLQRFQFGHTSTETILPKTKIAVRPTDRPLSGAALEATVCLPNSQNGRRLGRRDEQLCRDSPPGGWAGALVADFFQRCSFACSDALTRLFDAIQKPRI